MSKPDNPYAFPLAMTPESVDNPGMTLRDAFAIAALPTAWDACDKGYFDGGASEIAACSYQIADAMLAERAKGTAA